MTENDVNPPINNDPMEKETNFSITPRIILIPGIYQNIPK